MSDLRRSLIRVAVPAIVAGVVGVTSHLHLTVDQRDVTALATSAVGYGYYAGARLIEHRWPRLGVLLGVPRAVPVAPTTWSWQGTPTSVNTSVSAPVTASGVVTIPVIPVPPTS